MLYWVVKTANGAEPLIDFGTEDDIRAKRPVEVYGPFQRRTAAKGAVLDLSNSDPEVRAQAEKFRCADPRPAEGTTASAAQPAAPQEQPKGPEPVEEPAKPAKAKGKKK